MNSMDTDIDYLPERLEVKHAISDHKKLQCMFDIKAETDLKTGIKKTVPMG